LTTCWLNEKSRIWGDLCLDFQIGAQHIGGSCIKN
jgi:hypothetical protein